MIYGLYLSASGVMASSHRQDVIANNLANVETVGFKRNTPVFEQRLTEAQQMRMSKSSSDTNNILEELGGGLMVSSTATDYSQGEMEQTGNNLDVAINGKGFFAIDDHGAKRLTRDGRFMTDRNGNLILANGGGQTVLDKDGKPIVLDRNAPVSIGSAGEITQHGNLVATLGTFNPANPEALIKRGENLLEDPNSSKQTASASPLRSGFVEGANVDPTNEMTQLIDAQRQLEANANMIRYQDATLGRLVNDVGKIS
jgi:flagellar basal-body rod protein FlgF